MTEFIQNYEKQYKKLELVYKISTLILVTLLICFFVLSLFTTKNLNWLLFIVVVLSVIAMRKINQAFVSNVNMIAYKWMNDLDVDFAMYAFRVLLQNKKRKDYSFILSAYLNLLVIMHQFDEFEAVYNENRKAIQKSLYRILPFFREMFLGMMEDRSEYRDVIFKHKFSKYHNAENKLSKRAEALRKRDEQYMVQQMYEMREYEGLLDYLKKIHMATRYDHILYGTYRQRCLYQLDHSHEIILPEAPDFFCVQRLRYLKDTGEEYYFERAKEFADWCKEDYEEGKKLRNKKVRGVWLCLIAAGIILSFCLQTLTTVLTDVNEPVDEIEQILSEYDYEEYEEFEPQPSIQYEVGNNIFDNSDGSMYAFIDENTGWILNVNSAAAGSRWYDLSFTSDGGKTWEMIHPDPFAGSGGVVEGIAFYDAMYGYIAISGAGESHSRLFRTEDGGYTFEEIILPFDQCTEIENIEEYLYHYMPEIEGEKAEVVVKYMKDNADSGLLFQSEDAGKTWNYVGVTQ